MKTKDKILHASLEAFCEFGVAQVSTNHIADILDLSPGNVYYYFKNKQALVDELYGCFITDFVGFLQGGGKRVDSPARVWLVLSLCFQLMIKYRFVFRDANYVASKYPELRKRFNEVIYETRAAGDSFCQQLIDCGLMVAAPGEVNRLATNLHLVFTQWITYVEFLPFDRGRIRSDADPYRISQGIQQIVDLIFPYLDEDAREVFLAVDTSA
ncbi:MAG: TetR/AcrR family transcriptional regulator [Motiliproteus sp.]